MEIFTHKKGFTLIETLVAISLLGLVIGGLVTVTLLSIRELRIQKDKLIAVKIATEGMEFAVNKRDNYINCVATKCGAVGDWDDIKTNFVGTWKIDAATPEDLLADKKFKNYGAVGDFVCIENSGSDAGKFTYCGNNPAKVLPQQFDRKVEVTDLGPKVRIDSTVTWQEPLIGPQQITLTEVVFGMVPSGVPGLLAYWKLDEGGGSTANDSSGNGYTGNITSPAWTTGHLGQALALDGFSTYVNIGNIPAFDFPDTSFTVTGWFKTSASGVQQYIIAKRVSNANGWFLRINCGACNSDIDGALDAGIRDPADQNYDETSVSILNDGVWHFFAAVFTTDTASSPGNVVTLYVDGTLDQGPPSSTGVVYVPATTENLTVGAISDLSAGTFFPGTLDDIRVYSRALSPSEITAIFNGA